MRTLAATRDFAPLLDLVPDERVGLLADVDPGVRQANRIARRRARV